MQTIQSNFFIPAVLIGTSDFYCFIQFLVNSTKAECHKVSTKQNLLGSFSHMFFLAEWDEIWCSDRSV